MASQTTQVTELSIEAREPGHSRATRRLRRSGRIPGVLYGGGDEPMPFAVDERALRHALAARGAVIELSVGGGNATPAVLKDTQVHPVRNETLHVDFLRVDLKQAISAVVGVEFLGTDDAPGVKEGGVLEQITRELHIEALPTDIPEAIQVDVSQMQINDTLTLEAVRAPEGVTLLDDPQETVLASLTPPTIDAEAEEEALEEETERVGEGEGEAEGSAADAGDVPADASDSSSE
jgi:large subunit ribosomal protein L25